MGSVADIASTDDVSIALEAVEAEGYADLWSAAPLAVAERHGIAWTRIDGAVCRGVSSAPSSRLLNQVTGVGADPWSGERIDRLTGFYAGLGVAPVVAVPPFAHTDLTEGLALRGYSPSYAWAKFHRGVEPPPPGDTDLELVDATVDPAAYGRIIAAGFDLPVTMADWFAGVVGRPRWHTFLALEGATPVAAGGLFVDGDVGWFGAAATLPEHRGRGAQGALMAERALRARELGCRALATETGVPVDGRPGPSYRNMLRHGFRVAYDRPNLVSPTPANSGPT